jgi:GxxExxY protein
MHEGHQAIPAHVEAIGRDVVDACLVVHRALGPGLLESAYEACLAHELEQRSHLVSRQLVLPIFFKDIRLEAGYRIDLMVDDHVIVEVKAVERLAPVSEAQLLTYLRLSGRRLGYLLNFNVPLMKQAIHRRVL